MITKCVSLKDRINPWIKAEIKKLNNVIFCYLNKIYYQKDYTTILEIWLHQKLNELKLNTIRLYLKVLDPTQKKLGTL